MLPMRRNYLRTLSKLAQQSNLFHYTTRRFVSNMGAPVILCGKTEEIGRGVVASLKPEYDVIHFIMTPDAGIAQIPAILKGEQVPASGSTLGSKDYSEPPIAIVLGAGYDDADAEVMMRASAGIRPMPWLRPDLTKPAPPLGPEYGKALVARIKELLAELQSEGKMEEEKIRWY